MVLNGIRVWIRFLQAVEICARAKIIRDRSFKIVISNVSATTLHQYQNEGLQKAVI